MFATTKPPFKLVGAYRFSLPITLAPGAQVANAVVTANTQGDTAVAFPLASTIDFPYHPSIGGQSVATKITSVVALPLTGPTSQLAWESQNLGVSDAYQIVLYQVTGTTLQPIREYTIASGPLTFDTQLIQAGTSYAFRIRALRGMPNAKLGGFDTWNETQEMTQIWTQAFQRQ